MRFPPFLIALLFLTAWLPTLPAAAFEEAHAAFAAGDYAKAATTLQDLITREGPSTARLFNLGNAQARLNQYGPAILSYERAALLAPRDPGIRANLKLAREAAATPDSATPPSWGKMPLYWLSLREWSGLTAMGTILLALASMIWGISGPGRPPWWKAASRTALLVGLIATVPGAFALAQRSGEKSLGIILAGKPTLRLSPFPEANATDSPGTGRRVILGQQRNGWVYVTVDGSSAAGWLAREDVSPIIPAS